MNIDTRYDTLDLLRILIKTSGAWKSGFDNTAKLVKLGYLKPTNIGNSATFYPADYQLTEKAYLLIDKVNEIIENDLLTG